MNNTIGILLAGGYGTRLYPLTKYQNKHLINLYNKPMIYYSLSTLLLMGIKEIIIVSTKEAIIEFKKILYNGEVLGLKISYVVQYQPKGILDGIKICRNQIDKKNILCILGDNVFYGETFPKNIKIGKKSKIFTYIVNNPSQYGVAVFKNNKIVDIIEKPKKLISKFAITGLYYYKNKDLMFIDKIKKSQRGEYEITDFNKYILKNSFLEFQTLGRGTYWMDTGTFEGFLDCSNFISNVQKRTNLEIACIEEICLNKNFLNKTKFKNLIINYPKSDYKIYLEKLVNEK